MRYQDPRLLERLAAEYVLGTLQGKARQRFEGLLRAYPSLRREVRDWEARLNRLAPAAPAVAPPARVWRSLQRRLFTDRPSRAGWFQSLALWRGLALGSATLAGVLAVVLTVAPLAWKAPGYVVMIHANASHEPVWMVSTSAAMNRFYIKNMKPLWTSEEQRCLLWLQPKGSQQVYPLGVLPDKGDTLLLEVHEEMRPMLPGKLLVTVERAQEMLPQHPSSAPQFVGEWMPVKGI